MLGERGSRLGTQNQFLSATSLGYFDPTMHEVTSPFKLSSSQVAFKRPETPEYFRGKEGTKKNVASNYLQLECEANKGIFHYEVDFEPQIDNRQERFRLLKALEGITGPVKVCFSATLVRLALLNV